MLLLDEALARKILVIARVFAVGTVVTHNPIGIFGNNNIKFQDAWHCIFGQVWLSDCLAVDGQFAVDVAADNAVALDTDNSLDQVLS